MTVATVRVGVLWSGWRVYGLDGTMVWVEGLWTVWVEAPAHRSEGVASFSCSIIVMLSK